MELHYEELWGLGLDLRDGGSPVPLSQKSWGFLGRFLVGSGMTWNFFRSLHPGTFWGKF